MQWLHEWEITEPGGHFQVFWLSGSLLARKQWLQEVPPKYVGHGMFGYTGVVWWRKTILQIRIFMPILMKFQSFFVVLPLSDSHSGIKWTPFFRILPMIWPPFGVSKMGFQDPKNVVFGRFWRNSVKKPEKSVFCRLSDPKNLIFDDFFRFFPGGGRETEKTRKKRRPIRVRKSGFFRKVMEKRWFLTIFWRFWLKTTKKPEKCVFCRLSGVRTPLATSGYDPPPQGGGTPPQKRVVFPIFADDFPFLSSEFKQSIATAL